MTNWENKHYFACHEVGNIECPYCWAPNKKAEKCNSPNCTGIIHVEHECSGYDEIDGENICFEYFECDQCHKQAANE